MMPKLNTNQIDLIVGNILKDFKGLKIGDLWYPVANEQLHFRIRRALFAAQNGELEAELPNEGRDK